MAERHAGGLVMNETAQAVRDALVNEVVQYVREKAAENEHLGTIYPASEVLDSMADLIAHRFGSVGGHDRLPKKGRVLWGGGRR